MIPYFFYGSGMYRKHPNHTYGRNRNDSANNRAIMIIKFPDFPDLSYDFNITEHIEL